MRPSPRTAAFAATVPLLLASAAPAMAARGAPPDPERMRTPIRWEDRAALIQEAFQADPFHPMFLGPSDQYPAPVGPVASDGEFEPVSGLLLSYIDYGSDSFDRGYVEMVRALVDDIPLYVYYWGTDKRHLRGEMEEGGVDPDHPNLLWIEHYLDSIWIRDFGPFLVWDGEESTTLSIVDVPYYPDYSWPSEETYEDAYARPDDNEQPIHWSEYTQLGLYDMKVAMEGGNFAANGNGLCVVSDIVGYYNPHLEVADLELMYSAYLGCTQLVIAEALPSSVDATGHVDMWMTWLDPVTVMVGQYDPDAESNNEDATAILERNAALFAGLTDPGSGEPIQVVRVPMPDLYRAWGYTVDRTFTNSFMVNGKVLMPVYDPQDDDDPERLDAQEAEAIAAYEAAGFEVVPIESTDLIEWAGSIHCITKLVPTQAEEPPVGDDDDTAPADDDSAPAGDDDLEADDDAPEDASGCTGCSAAPGGAPGAPLLGLLVLGAARRRR